ncbi:hypothetical protein AAE045_13390 [Dryocola clanedunensis]
MTEIPIRKYFTLHCSARIHALFSPENQYRKVKSPKGHFGINFIRRAERFTLYSVAGSGQSALMYSQCAQLYKGMKSAVAILF